MGQGKVWNSLRGMALGLGILCLLAAEVMGQSVELGGTVPGRAALTMSAVRVQSSPPVIDGRLDDPAWRNAPVVSGFVQFDPKEGAPATHDSEVRVLYDDQAIYVAFRAFDPSPNSGSLEPLGRIGESTSPGTSHATTRPPPGLPFPGTTRPWFPGPESWRVWRTLSQPLAWRSSPIP